MDSLGPFVFIGVANYGPLYIMAMLKKHNFDARGLFRSLDEIRDMQPVPTFVGFSCWTGEHRKQYLWAQRVKELFPKCVVCFGGPHAIICPDEIMSQQAVDMVCVGEGEYTILELAERLRDRQSLNEIEGLWTKDEAGTVHKTKPRPLVEDLDTLPFMDRSGFVYDAPDSPHSGFQTGRGCVNSCKFCYHNVFRRRFEGRYFRKRSVDNVIAEIQQACQKYSYASIKFKDDTFIASRSWLREFADKFPQEVGLPFIAAVIPSQVDEEVATLLKKAGCISVGLGIESGNDFIRQNILGKRFARERIVAAFNACKNAGIESLVGQWIIANPYETVETVLESIALHCELQDRPIVHFYTPYPGTETTNRAIREGWLSPEDCEVDSGLLDHIYVRFSEETKLCFYELQKLFYLFTPSAALFSAFREQVLQQANDRTRLRILQKWRKKLEAIHGKVRPVMDEDTGHIAMLTLAKRPPTSRVRYMLIKIRELMAHL